MEEKIKASELLAKIYEELIEMKTQLREVKELSKLMTYQYNLLLKKVNDMGSVVSAQPTQKASVIATAMETMPQMDKQTKPAMPKRARLGDVPEGERPVPEPKEIKTVVNIDYKTPPPNAVKPQKYDFDVQKETSSPSEAPAAQQTNLNSQVPVTQVVYTKEGKPVSLASVEITDPSGKVVNKSRTNNVGRWQVLLAPGDYTVHVLRRYIKGQEEGEVVEYNQPIRVVPSEKKLEIQAPEEYRNKVQSSAFKK